MGLAKVIIHRDHRVRAYDDKKNKIKMLSGDYYNVKYKLLPAINSCNPQVLDSTGRIMIDIVRFCSARESPADYPRAYNFSSGALEEALKAGGHQEIKNPDDVHK